MKKEKTVTRVVYPNIVKTTTTTNNNNDNNDNYTPVVFVEL